MREHSENERREQEAGNIGMLLYVVTSVCLEVSRYLGVEATRENLRKRTERKRGAKERKREGEGREQRREKREGRRLSVFLYS